MGLKELLSVCIIMKFIIFHGTIHYISMLKKKKPSIVTNVRWWSRYWQGNLLILFIFYTQNLVLLSPLLDCCPLLLRLQTCRLLQTLKHTKPKRRRRKTSTNINTSTNMTGLTKIHWGGSARGPSTAPRTRPA